MLMQLLGSLQLIPCLLCFFAGGAVVLFAARAVLKKKKERFTKMYQKIKELEAGNLQLMEDLGALRSAAAKTETSFPDSDQKNNFNIVPLRPRNAEQKEAASYA